MKIAFKGRWKLKFESKIVCKITKKSLNLANFPHFLNFHFLISTLVFLFFKIQNPSRREEGGTKIVKVFMIKGINNSGFIREKHTKKQAKNRILDFFPFLSLHFSFIRFLLWCWVLFLAVYFRILWPGKQWER